MPATGSWFRQHALALWFLGLGGLGLLRGSMRAMRDGAAPGDPIALAWLGGSALLLALGLAQLLRRRR